MNKFAFLGGLVLVGLVVAVVLLVLAFFASGDEGLPLFLLGTATLICTIAIAVLRGLGSMLLGGRKPATQKPVMLAALLGLFLGGLVGAQIGLGKVVASIFNPKLVEPETLSSLGAMYGALLGAFLLALLAGVLQMVMASRQAVAPLEGSENANVGEQSV